MVREHDYELWIDITADGNYNFYLVNQLWITINIAFSIFIHMTNTKNCKKTMNENRAKAYKKLEKTKKFLSFYKNLTEGTKRAYKYYIAELVIFLDFINLDKYIKDIYTMKRPEEKKYKQQIKNDITSFIAYSEKNRKPKPFAPKSINIAISAIQELLDTHEIELPRHFYKSLRKRNGQSSITNSKTPTKEELKIIFSACDLEITAFSLCVLSSISRPGEILNLDFDDIDTNSDYPRFEITPENSKTNKKIKKRISPEAKEYLLKYKENERKRFLETRKKRNKHLNSKDKTNKLFPISISTLNAKWKRALKKVNLYELDKNSNRPT